MFVVQIMILEAVNVSFDFFPSFTLGRLTVDAHSSAYKHKTTNTMTIKKTTTERKAPQNERKNKKNSEFESKKEENELRRCFVKTIISGNACVN